VRTAVRFARVFRLIDRMTNQPKKPRARARRKVSAQQGTSVEEAANSVAVVDEAPAGAPEAAAPATSLQGGASLDVALDVARAEQMAEELADLAGADSVPAPDDQLEEERIRSVKELLALGAGEVELLLFRVGAESFAFDLAAAEEAVELESVHAVPDMPDAMLGVFDLRGRLIPVYSPSAMLCTPDSPTSGVLLLMRAGERRVGIVVDDVEDVVVLEHGMLRPPPSADADGLVLGVAFFGDTLVTILDAHALVATCAAPVTAEVA
jgi:purine-binding chemotaxis protein CheW